MLQRADARISYYRHQHQGKSQLSGIFPHFTATPTHCFPSSSSLAIHGSMTMPARPAAATSRRPSPACATPCFACCGPFPFRPAPLAKSLPKTVSARSTSHSRAFFEWPCPALGLPGRFAPWVDGDAGLAEPWSAGLVSWAETPQGRVCGCSDRNALRRGGAGRHKIGGKRDEGSAQNPAQPDKNRYYRRIDETTNAEITQEGQAAGGGDGIRTHGTPLQCTTV